MGILTLLLFYLVARTLDLQLTSFVLKYFGSIMVIVLTIVFQTEIRRYLELIGLISTRRLKAKRSGAGASLTTEIVQTCIQMAQLQIGALIVIEGEQSVDSYVKGGVSLDGLLSEELLLSIFDTSSAGHDGAVIVKQDRVTKFGAHLPLSNNFKQIGKHGTRHSAGLGLSEYTDAIIVIVSEEKGTISIAYKGKLKELERVEHLENKIEKYLYYTDSNQGKNQITDLVAHNTLYKVSAVLVAIILKLLLSRGV